MKTFKLFAILIAFSKLTFAQDVSYNTVKTTATAQNNQTSITIMGANNNEGPTGARNISFEFAAAGKAKIQAYRTYGWGSVLEFLTSDDGDTGGSPSVRMHINRTGNVGIGTSSPTEKLSVNGKIRAHEIKVETANWPDYVFAKDYELPSLDETEKHIQQNGHLPGIPSAEEVKANGIDLGEMNAKLLKKIEELTLYLIESEKRNTLQNAKQQNLIDQQQKDIKYLKSKLK